MRWTEIDKVEEKQDIEKSLKPMKQKKNEINFWVVKGKSNFYGLKILHIFDVDSYHAAHENSRKSSQDQN